MREIARREGLPNHDKRDSTGICFIGERPFPRIPEPLSARRSGPHLSLDGRLVGEHMGLMFYTLGQRQGLGIGGQRDGDGDAWYVVDKDMKRNRLLVVQGRENRALYSNRLTAVQLELDQRHGAALQLGLRREDALSAERRAVHDRRSATTRAARSISRKRSGR